MLNNNNNSIIYMMPLQHIPYLEIILLPEVAAGRQHPPKHRQHSCLMTLYHQTDNKSKKSQNFKNYM